LRDAADVEGSGGGYDGAKALAGLLLDVFEFGVVHQVTTAEEFGHLGVGTTEEVEEPGMGGGALAET
jgi:hypothetical protein